MVVLYFFFFFNDTATTEIYTLSLHDALPISTAVETFRASPALAMEIQDADLLSSIYDVAAEISRRSAKHSADFLNATSTVVDRLLKYSEAPFSGGVSPPGAGPGPGRRPPLNH